jgi:hypothetical protein
MRTKSKNELVSELAFTQAKLDIAIREFNKMIERKNLEIAQAHAAGRTAGLQEAMGITLAVGDSVRDEYNDTTELAERHAVTRCVNSIKGAIEALK